MCCMPLRLWGGVAGLTAPGLAEGKQLMTKQLTGCKTFVKHLSIQ